MHADGIVEHDGHVGELLDLLDELKIADNTIVIYSTDIGAELALWPDGAMPQFNGEKGSTWEGGFRIPMMIRWPDKIKPNSVSNEIISNLDWFPTLLAASGNETIKEDLASGTRLGGKKYNVKLDGYNFMPYMTGKAEQGPRERIFYFDQSGNLNAVRWNDWKVSFAVQKGNIATGSREVTNWAGITNLRMDPYEKAMEEGGGYWTWYAQQMWLLVPIQQQIKDFFSDFSEYPYQAGSSLNAGNINYGLIEQKAAMKRLTELESLKPR